MREKVIEGSTKGKGGLVSNSHIGLIVKILIIKNCGQALKREKNRL